MSKPLDPDRSLWHLIAVEVQRQRELHDLSGNGLAQILDCDRSTVSRIENGLRRLSLAYAASLDDLWDMSGLFVRLVRYAAVNEDNKEWFAGLRENEARATRWRTWETLMVPGLFQTPDYARAVFKAGSPLDAEELLEARLSRQAAVFERKEPPFLAVIINWAVLEHVIGDSAIMRGQLSHLVEMSEFSNVDIRIVENSAGAHTGVDGPFNLLTVDDRDVVFADMPDGRGRLFIDPAVVQRFAVKYDRISGVASPVSRTRELIERALEQH